jgi:hypothetical protein
MSPAGTNLCWLMAGTAAVLLTWSAPAGNVVAGPGETNRLAAVSPVETFRKLLALSPAQREQFLTNYPAARRERIQAKVEEYQLLPLDLREVRLQMTELRWYLLPMLDLPRTNRAERLEQIPEPYRQLVASRLEEWDLWPPDLRDEVIQYETTMHYFVGQGAGGDTVIRPQTDFEDVPEKDRPELEQKLAHWRALPPAERDQLYKSFRHFFELSEAEQQKTLEALSEPVRRETEKVLNPIERWPRSQQQIYMTAFRQFANMSPGEREQFMRNAERWRQMSPAERQAWRDLVSHLRTSRPVPRGLDTPHARPVGPRLPAFVTTNSSGTVPP